MKPRLHYTPATGWMNDPNGLVYRHGRHHMFYQYNPAGTAFTNQHWGHASSADLLTWTEHPVALYPGPDGYDATACFSGCAVEHGDGVSFLYTGVGGGRTLPCLAHAAGDGLATLRKDQANPVVAAVPGEDVTDFRDHTVWRTGGQWWQLVGGARAGHGGTLFAYSAEDLRSWTFRGVYTDSVRSGVPGAVWECPDHIAAAGGSALVVSVIHEDGAAGGPEVWWMTGRATGGGFAVAGVGVCDVGDRFYAPQSYPLPDGRRMQFGWVRVHQDPAWCDGPAVGAMSLPRELSIRAGRVHVAPAAELSGLRGSLLQTRVRAAVTAIALGDARVAGELVLDARAASGVRRVMLCHRDGSEMTVDLSAFADRGGELRLFWDAGIVEVYRGGLAGTWTDLRVVEAVELRLDGCPSATGTADVWRLARPGRRAQPAGSN